MAGTINLSMSQRLDALGKPLAGGQLFFYAAGTTTFQNAYFDTALTLPHPNPITLDAAGNIPQFFLADGQIKIVLTDRFGVTQLNADNLLVLGPSSGGGGGGGSVDPTTILQTGAILPFYGTGTRIGFVRANGRTIGSAVSPATERPNADTQALFSHLYGQDVNLAVSGGRGASAAADYSAGKTIALPDYRSTVIAGLDDMGNTAASRFTVGYFGTDPTVLGAVGGSESQTLTQAQLPASSYLLAGVNGAVITASTAQLASGTIQQISVSGSGSNYDVFATGTGSNAFRASTGNFTPAGSIGPIGNGFGHPIVQRTSLTTIYVKL
jgi:microcystin-dependent protein